MITHVDSEDSYVRITLGCDEILTEGRFTRVCDYGRRITSDDLNGYRKLLDEEQKERTMHRFLTSRLHLVVNTDPAHGCRWIKSNPSLGGERSPDFMTARRDSSGLRWSIYELQNVITPLFLVNGQPSQELREGLYQIGQWRSWLSHADDVLLEALSGGEGEISRWPTDSEFSDFLRTRDVYGTVSQPRLVMALAAVEASLYSNKTDAPELASARCPWST
jgi:hypothetical protein